MLEFAFTAVPFVCFVAFVVRLRADFESFRLDNGPPWSQGAFEKSGLGNQAVEALTS